MPIALAGEFSGTTAAATTLSITGVNAIAGTIAVAICHIKAGSSVSVQSITDPGGNTWNMRQIATQSGSNSRIEIWTAAIASPLSAASVSINLNVSGSARASISVWSGAAIPISVDAVNGAGSAATTTPPSVTVTTTDPGDVIIGGISYASSSAPSSGPGSGWTTLSAGSPSSTFYGAAAYALPGTAGVFGPTWTLAASAASGSATIALKPLSTGPFVTDYSGSGSAVTSYAITGVSAVINTIAVAVCHIKAGGGTSVQSITDTAGNIWTFRQESHQSGANSRVEIWTATITASLSNGTITIAHSAAASGRVDISIWRNMYLPPSVEAINAASSATSTAPTTAPVNISTPGCVVIGGISYADSMAPTSGPGPGWTSLAGGSPASAFYGAAAYTVAGTAGTFAPAWTLSNAAAAGSLTIALRPKPTSHAVQLGKWRWFTDAVDASMTALAAENSTVQISASHMQNAVLRLRLQLTEISGNAGSGAIDIQYEGGSGVWRSIESRVPANDQEGVWFRWADGVAVAGAALTSTKLSGTLASGLYHETVNLSESVPSNGVVEIDLALLIHWPPPDTTVNFRILYGGVSCDPGLTSAPISLATSPAAQRPNTVVRLDGDTSSKTSREIRFSAWERMVYDPRNKQWWLFLVQFNTPNILRSYCYQTLANTWQAGPVYDFGSSISGNQGNNNFCFRDNGTQIAVYGQFGSSTTSRYIVKGVISQAGALTWSPHVTIAQSSARCRVIGVDDGGYIWLVGLTAGSGLWVRRSTAPDSIDTWNSAFTIDDSSVISGDVVALVGLGVNRCLVLWRPNNAVGNVAMGYAVVNGAGVVSTGSATTTPSTSTEDWGVTRANGFVYLLHSDSFSAGGNWVFRVFSEASETWQTGPSPQVSGQPSTHDGLIICSAGNKLFAFGTEVGIEGKQDRIVKYKVFTGIGASGAWGPAYTSLTGVGGRINGDHLSAPRRAGGGLIPLLLEFGDDNVTGNARGIEYWPLSVAQLSAKVRVSSAWQQRTAYRRINGSWVPITILVRKSGDWS